MLCPLRGRVALVDIIELQVYGSLKADARNIRPVEENVRCNGTPKQDEDSRQE